MILVFCGVKEEGKSLEDRRRTRGVRVGASFAASRRYKVYTLLVHLLDPFLGRFRAFISHMWKPTMIASMVGGQTSDLGPLRGHKAGRGCFCTHGRLHAT